MTQQINPWAIALITAHSIPDLTRLWEEWASDSALHASVDLLLNQGIDTTPAEVRSMMALDWTARKAELEAAAPPPPNPEAQASALEHLDEVLEESRIAVEDFGAAVKAYGQSHGSYKKVRAKRFLQAKGEAAAAGEKMTDGEANMICDADDAVADLYLRSEIDDALVKAARARLEDIDRRFNHYRSLYVRQDRVDQRG